MNDYAKGLCFLRDAYSILYDHCPRMLSKSEWNLAGKTAYDAREKVAKSVELLARIKTTTKHDVRLQASILDRVPLVAWRVESDPMESISICIQKATSPDPHVSLCKAVYGTLTQLATRAVGCFDDIRLILDGSTIRVLSGSTPLFCLTDTSAGITLDGHWVQVAIDQNQLGVLNKHLELISSGRNTTAYYAKQYSRAEATRICDDGKDLFVPVKRRIGHQVPFA